MTCKETLLNFINSTDGWHKKVSLYAVAEDYSPETVGRELRLLANPEDGSEPKIEIGYYDGKIKKGLAMYCKIGTPKPTVPKFEIIEIDGQRKAVPVGSR